MLLLFVALAVQGAFCASCVESQGCLGQEEIGQHEVLVRFKPAGERQCCLRWDTYGLPSFFLIATEAVLERNLLNGNSGQVVDGSEIYALLNQGSCSLMHCPPWRVRCCVNDSLPDVRSSFVEMFPEGAKKTWRVFAPGCLEGCADEEVQVLFFAGEYSCQPACKENNTCASPKSQRVLQMMQDVQGPFVARLRGFAKQRMRDVQAITQVEGAKIIVKHTDWLGRRFGVEWDGKDVLDRNGYSIGAFLRNCIMLGTSLGYVDEGAIRHYAFINNHLILRVLETFLVFDLLCDVRVKPLDGVMMLHASRLRIAELYSWTVMPRGSLLRTTSCNSWFITFGDVTLAGTFISDARVRVPGIYDDMVYPRSFLWGLESDRILREKPEGKTWCEYHVRSDRIRLAEIGKAIVQFQPHEGRLHQVIWDIKDVVLGEGSAEEVLRQRFITAFRGGGALVSDLNMLGVDQLLKKRLEEDLRKNDGLSYVFSEGEPLCFKQFLEMFPKGARKAWQCALVGDPRDFLKGEVRILFAGGGLRCLPASQGDVCNQNGMALF